MKLSIVVPAHNEEARIQTMLETYSRYFANLSAKHDLTTEFVVVLNGCTDNTAAVVKKIQQSQPHIIVLDFAKAGKGFAITEGFRNALTRPNDLIGFVDADMATLPQYYFDLVQQIGSADGIIASRYMPGAIVDPPRPWVKRWGSKLFYGNLVWALFGMDYYDTQCGAKLFKRHVIETIEPELMIDQWAFDVEILYLCKKHNFQIKEVPTVWYDKAGSKLQIMKSGMRMLGALFEIRWKHK